MNLALRVWELNILENLDSICHGVCDMFVYVTYLLMFIYAAHLFIFVYSDLIMEFDAYLELCPLFVIAC